MACDVTELGFRNDRVSWPSHEAERAWRRSRALSCNNSGFLLISVITPAASMQWGPRREVRAKSYKGAVMQGAITVR